MNTIDATRTLLHIRYLAQHGLTLQSLATACNIPAPILHQAITEATTHNVTTPNIETAILRVKVERPYNDPNIPLRKLQALVALGHSVDHIAQRLSVTVGTVYALLKQERTIRQVHAQNINTLYDELHAIAGTDVRARRKAQKMRWLPPLAWDDIEDPNEKPSREHVRKRTVDILHHEDLAELLAQGNTPEAIAQRYGIKVSSVVRAMWRLKNTA